MRATVNRVLKNNDMTLGVCEITINEGHLNCTLNVSNDEDIKTTGVPIDIDLCLYSENLEVIGDSAEYEESITAKRTDNEMETYCIVKGKITDLFSFKDQLFLDVECRGQILNIVSYETMMYQMKRGDYISALCWVEIIENNPKELLDFKA